jgi:catechol 2,3-dioxygenase-like lactoylglutathione lyase family enzyme
MAIKALSYIGVNSDKFEDWSHYTQKSLGMQLVDRGKDILSFRMDDQKQRLTITGNKGDNLGFMGWEVDEKDDLLLFASKLERNKIQVHQGKTSFADKRFVDDLIYFNDPQGNRIELVFNPMNDTDPFKPNRPISGFKTGALGMGHAVIHVKKIDDLIPFYTEVLGFRISDTAIHQFLYVFFT